MQKYHNKIFCRSIYLLSLPTPQRYKNNADEKRSCNDFFFRQHILRCQCTNKFSPFWVYSQWNKLNLLVYLYYCLFS